MSKTKSDSKRDERTKSILSTMENENSMASQNNNRQHVTDLKPGTLVRRLELVVLRRYPRRLVNSKNYTGALAAACGRDETGLVGLVLWDDDVKKVRVGDIIRIENGWCRLRDGEIVVSTGRSGTLTILDR